MSHSGDEPSTKTKLRLAKKLANELLSVADGLLTPPGCIGLKNHTCLSNEHLPVADGLLTPPGCISLKNHTCLSNEHLPVADGLLTPPGCIGLKNHTCLSTADHETQGTSTAMSIIRNQECKSIDLGLTPELLGLV